MTAEINNIQPLGNSLSTPAASYPRENDSLSQASIERFQKALASEDYQTDGVVIPLSCPQEQKTNFPQPNEVKEAGAYHSQTPAVIRAFSTIPHDAGARVSISENIPVVAFATSETTVPSHIAPSEGFQAPDGFGTALISSNVVRTNIQQPAPTDSTSSVIIEKTTVTSQTAFAKPQAVVIENIVADRNAT